MTVALGIGLEVKRAETITVKATLPHPYRFFIKIEHPRDIDRSKPVIQQQKRIGPANF